MVRKGGLEPPCLSAPPPQDGVSANFTTSARCKNRCFNYLAGPRLRVTLIAPAEYVFRARCGIFLRSLVRQANKELMDRVCLRINLALRGFYSIVPCHVLQRKRVRVLGQKKRRVATREPGVGVGCGPQATWPGSCLHCHIDSRGWFLITSRQWSPSIPS